MRQSEQINEIASALAAFHAEAPTITFDGAANAGSYKYKYATLPQILDKVRPILAKHGLAVLQPVGESGSVETIIVHTSGQWIASDPVRLPSKDNSPQGVGSAISYAKRYSLSAMLALAAEEDDDGQAAQREHGKRESAPSNGGAKSGTISEAQAKRFYAIAGNHGWGKPETEKMLELVSYSSAKEIERERYDSLCNALENPEKLESIRSKLMESESA